MHRTRREDRFGPSGSAALGRSIPSPLEGSVPSATFQADQCVVALWRGYVKAQFYARLRGRDEALCYSPMFRTWRPPWQRGVPMREDAAARAALGALETTLWEYGWERMRRSAGAEWYELRFRPATAETRSAAPRPPLVADSRPRNAGKPRSAARRLGATVFAFVSTVALRLRLRSADLASSVSGGARRFGSAIRFLWRWAIARVSSRGELGGRETSGR